MIVNADLSNVTVTPIPPPQTDRSRLADTLAQIVEHDQDYEARYPLVWQALSLALAVGFTGGVRLDPNEPEWPVVYIDLPDGQVSWHMPQYAKPWDGHTTEEKLGRIREFRVRRLPNEPGHWR